MKNSKTLFCFISLCLLITLAACSPSPTPSNGQISLYGEQHGIEKILEKEIEAWHECYQTEGMRHLFVELPYYSAEFFNLWMQEDNDDILDAVYNDWEGTAVQNPYTKAFYQKIKSDYPETVFHGTDVGHQYNTTGERFLKYLEDNNMKNTEQYSLTKETIEQGKYYYDHSDHVYRENKMAENFIREFDSLNGENVMGIYGGAHIGLDAMDYATQSVPCMANQLKKRYGDAVYSEDLSWLIKDIEPLRTDTINVNGKDYEALYFGKQELSGIKDYTYREFWRLESAYEDFKGKPKTGDVLPYNNYPMIIETEQVFVIDYTKSDGSVVRMYYRSDGSMWNGAMTTEEFTAE